MRCQFIILKNTPTEVIIRDIGWSIGMSVTNDAESAVEYLMLHGYLYAGKRLLYYDSEDQLDEITFDKHGFTGFKPLGLSPNG